jgi:hypothetical protein
MELTDERLKKALEAGNILVTEKAFATLSEWIDKVGPATFFVAECMRGTRKSCTDLKKELSGLCKALQSTVDILIRDNGQLVAFLCEEFLCEVPSVSVSFFSANTRPRLIEQQRDLLIRAQAALKQLQAVKNRSGAPEHENTWILHSVRSLYGVLTGVRNPAIGKPLYRFTKEFAELIGASGIVPEDFNTFRGRFR